MTVALDKIFEILPSTFIADNATGRLLILSAKDELAQLKNRQGYEGHCFRHRLLFIPSEQFNNNCPACFWERDAAEERFLRETGRE